MTMTSVDLDPELIARAREVTGERTNGAVIDLALRRLVASRQKGTMIEAIAELDGLAEGLAAPVVTPPSTRPTTSSTTRSGRG
ncbi:type II toxin-antitoxin system VapB family antitoxin [Mobilicoccus pelagius]|uniref:Antitoxin n=1 Tax=Mobilicoccus pelagius NBRC 104925 TaxID=1089455 RepID=H5UUX5_9MICO|nr:type II toxin-antitoxin system VapB family antitoxin [Mobilicoccus pelagius]GAB49533.1 hypothetical protein MOPEL_130_01400 [Mobilicoccus pelagius NBRC 104925]